MRVELVTPLPIVEWKDSAWAWLHEFRESNFDDTGPRTPDELVASLLARSTLVTWGVVVDGEPSGMVGYQPVTSRLGMLSGVCFRKAVHGTGAPSLAFRKILERLWALGVEKINATYFADNAHIRRFLQQHGAVDEGLMVAHTLRHGVPTDMRLVAIFKDRG